jgi:hypothetical protein
MRRIALAAIIIAASAGAAFAQPVPPEPVPGVKPNANPCSDEVSASLQKLRRSSWFRMDSNMLTEKGPTSMQVDYVLPDRMHQKVTVKLTNETSEVILVGNQAWSRKGEGSWQQLKPMVADHLKTQMQETVVQQQADVGSYACKGRTNFDGHDVFSYKLESEPEKDASADQKQTFRMFYVDAVTGLPVSNALLVPGHEDKPIFKTTYTFPLEIKIDPPKDVVEAAPNAASPAAPAAPAAQTTPNQTPPPPATPAPAPADK